MWGAYLEGPVVNLELILGGEKEREVSKSLDPVLVPTVISPTPIPPNSSQSSNSTSRSPHTLTPPLFPF